MPGWLPASGWRGLVVATACLIATASGESKAKAPPAYPSDVKVEADVAYLPEDRKEKADLYHPPQRPEGTRLPAVLVIHGGGFNDGDKARAREINIGRHLALNGFVAMSINYKLRRMKDQVTWPQSVHDAKTAVRWLRKNADALGIDPERIGVIGCSAGGNLAAMLATTGPADGLDPAAPLAEFSAHVRCAVDFYGAVDLMNYHDMKMFAKTRAEAPELYRKASPVTYVDAKDAPILMVHGTADETVPLSQSETLAAALKAAGVEHELIVVPGGPHTFYLESKDLDLRPQVLGFLRKHLTAPTPATTHRAAPRAAAVFFDHMVIQRGMPAPVWGWAAPGEEITVNFAGQSVSATAAADGKWMVRLAPLSCPSGNQSQTLVIRGMTGETAIRDILIGDLWICGGQSNMAFKLNDSTGGASAAKDDPLLRICDVSGKRSAAGQPAPRDLEMAEWKTATLSSAGSFSAVGYYFGEVLRESLGVPIGLIDTSVGGTPMRCWMSRERMEADELLRPEVVRCDQDAQEYPMLMERYKKQLARHQAEAGGTRRKPNPPKSPDSSYRLAYFHTSVIRPLQPLAMKGVIWYQGEADAGRHAVFQHQFSTLVAEWRNEWGQGDFPWLYCQLAPYSQNVGRHFPRVWEAQSNARSIPNSAMVVTLDRGVSGNIHPPDKKTVGERLALAARHLVYQQDVNWRYPEFKSMETKGNTLIVRFDAIGDGLAAHDQALRHFTIAGADRKFLPATATLAADHSVMVSHPDLAGPVAVRYGWYDKGGEVGASLFGRNGLPVAPFRTDDWQD